MRLKLFHASTITGAMALIRSELGPDALILNTRRVSGGIEVTAATEPGPIEPPPPLLRLPDERPSAASTPPELSRDALLLWHGVPRALSGSLKGECLALALAQRLAFSPLPLEPDPHLPRPLMVAGPPGAGKTLTIARLATRMVMAGQSPMVITSDAQRAGATEQLLAFTRVLNISLIVADQPRLLARALARRGSEPVLIDLPGLDPTDVTSAGFMDAMSSVCAANIALILPAGLDPNEAGDMAGGFAAAGATHLVATRLDLCRRLGGILAAAEAGRLAMAEAGIGAGAVDGLAALTPAFLANRMSAAYAANCSRLPEGVA